MRQAKVRLEYLDGLRGLAALFVVFHHAFVTFYYAPQAVRAGLASPLATFLAILFKSLFTFGHEAVVVFIVLSGYVLMLPIARTVDGYMPHGVLDYLKRRARRILPPYYAALAFALLIIFCVPGMNRPFHAFWDTAIPITRWATIVSHLLLIHNHHGWDYAIDPPMWSIAVEWQIYFWFPFLLLPLWRRFGLWATIFCTWLFGLGGYYLHFGGTYFWLIGDFAFGMAAAAIGFWQADDMRLLRDKVAWGRLCICFAGIAYLLLIAPSVATYLHLQNNLYLRTFLVSHWHLGTGWEWPTDLLLGLATACFIVEATHRIQTGLSDNAALRLLHCRYIILLGTFSYSLYLVHFPILGLADKLCRVLRLSGERYFAVIFGVGIPACLVCSYLFHWVFERPFLPTHLRRGQSVSLERQSVPARSTHL